MSSPESLTNEAELEDVGDRFRFDWSRIDLRHLSSPVVMRALAAIAVATLILVWPERTDRILARLIGVGLISMGATGLFASLRRRPLNWPAVASGLAALGVGVWLVASPGQSEVVLGRIIGAGIALMALRDLAQVRTVDDRDQRAWIGARSLALGGLGVVLFAFPGEIFASVTVLAAVGWIALSLVVIAISLDARTTGVADYGDSTRLLADWLADRPKSVDDRQALYDKILYEGPSMTQRVVRFLALMTFASIIASMGVITDSTAVVIGAMLIAPLMTPLMGMAISLVMGWPSRLGRSALVAASGIALAIALGIALGFLAPAVIDTATNSQIVSRSSPTTLDLITAVAAGAAGAYGLSRPDVSDSLPGVAIAISLVPPLSVVGIAYSQGDWSAGNGALLLFSTNMLAILIVGGITFVATGVTPTRRVAENQHRVRTSIASVAFLAAAVLGALMLNGVEVAEGVLEESSTEQAISDWLDAYPDHSLVGFSRSGAVVTATVVGPSQNAPDAESLAVELAESLDRDITADVRLIVEERDVASASGG